MSCLTFVVTKEQKQGIKKALKAAKDDLKSFGIMSRTYSCKGNLLDYICGCWLIDRNKEKARKRGKKK